MSVWLEADQSVVVTIDGSFSRESFPCEYCLTSTLREPFFSGPLPQATKHILILSVSVYIYRFCVFCFFLKFPKI